MKKLIPGIACSIIAVSSLLCAPTSALSLAPCPDDENKAECEARQEQLVKCWDKTTNLEECEKQLKTQVNQSQESSSIPATFVAELDDSEQSIGFWAGKSFLLAGNNLKSSTDVRNGLLLAAGNNLQLSGQSEYGFLFGNIIKFSGSTQRDLYIAGNGVTLTSGAKIGRDVFVASGELRIETDLPGDLSVTADRLVIDEGITINGNVNIDADTIVFGRDVTIGGKLVYNDSANVSGADQVAYGDVEIYHLQEVSAEAKLAAAFYSKFLSIAGLFLAMALILAVYSKLHSKIETETTPGRFGTNLAIGLGALIIVPVVAIFAMLTVVAAPLSIIALLVYGICVYLAQGFTGLWLGHIILEKLFKIKGNAFVEALLGIIVLGLLALVPVVGVITGFVSLALGLGLIVNCVRPRKDDDRTAQKATKAKTSKAKAKTGKVVKK